MQEFSHVISSCPSSLASLLLIIILCKLLYSYCASRHFNMPPFVPGFPILGNSLQLNPAAPYRTFSDLTKQNGDIYSMHVWGSHLVIINEYGLLHEALVKQSQELAGRPYSFRLSAMNGFGHELVFADLSPEWVLKKHLVQRCFRRVGNFSPAWETASQRAMQVMLEELDKIASNKREVIVKEGSSYVLNRVMKSSVNQREQPDGLIREGRQEGSLIEVSNLGESNDKMETGTSLDPRTYLEKCCVQSISTVLFGREMTEDEYESLLPIIKEGTDLMSPAGPGVELDLIPGLSYLYFLFPWSTYWRLARIWEKQRDWMEHLVLRTQKLREEGMIVTRECLFDMLVEEAGMQTRAENVYSRKDIIATVATVLTGGVHPVSTVVYSVIGLLTKHRDVQEKVHEELQKVLGKRKPLLVDREKLHFTSATILETMRYTSTAPLIMRKTTSNIKIGGFDIPEETIVFGNLFHIHHDDRHWEEPWSFKPERFLNKEGKVIPPNTIKGYLPYGAGRRLCTGQAMARNKIFLLVCSLLRRYTFLKDYDTGAPDLDPNSYTPGLVPQPKPFRVKLKINPWS